MTTATLLAEIKDKTTTRLSVAKSYALALRSGLSVDWITVTKAIEKRWSRAALDNIKHLAHRGKDFSGSASEMCAAMSKAEPNMERV